LGKVVYEKPIPLEGNRNIIELSIPTLPVGIYTISLITHDNVYSSHFTKE